MTDNHSEPTLCLVDKSRLNALLQLRGMSRAELGRRLNMHANALNKIAASGRTSIDTLIKMCQVLECSPLDLITVQGFPDPFWAAPASRSKR